MRYRIISTSEFDKNKAGTIHHKIYDHVVDLSKIASTNPLYMHIIDETHYLFNYSELNPHMNSNCSWTFSVFYNMNKRSDRKIIV